MSGKVITLYEDSAKTTELYPITKTSAVIDADGNSLGEVASYTAQTVATSNTINFNTIKTRTTANTFTSLAGNTDSSITLPMPSDISLNNVIAIIVNGYTPSSSWDTRLFIKGTSNEQSEKNIFSYRTQGSTSQNYSINYTIIYYDN